MSQNFTQAKVPGLETQITPRAPIKKESLSSSPHKISHREIKHSLSPNRLQSKPLSPNRAFRLRSFMGDQLSPNKSSSSLLGSRSPIQKNLSPQRPVIADQAFNLKVQTLYDKILQEESKLVYENCEEDSMAKKPQEILSYIDEPTSPNLETIKVVSPTAQKDKKISIYDFELSLEHTVSNEKSPTTDKKEISIRNSKLNFKTNQKGSRFEEILELKNKNIELLEQNKQLRSDMDTIDEFDIVLKKKIKPENFNEKRCDILKACVFKQRRYISYLSQGFKLEKKFYKDLKFVLKYLIDLNEKYVNSKVKSHSNRFEHAKSQERVDISKKTLVDVYNDVGDPEVLKLFIKNFNEAYAKVQNSYEKNAEVEKLFKLDNDLDPTKDPLANVTNPEAQKKIKYSYMLNQFIEQYNQIFPMYTLFDEFELKDQQDLSEFVNHLVLTAGKVDEIFRKIKTFDMFKNESFGQNEDTPENLISNFSNFKYYFDHSNKSKRIFLESKHIFDVEKSLSFLLTELMTFHNNLATKKESISLESIMNLQKNLRENIEALLLLGINSTCDFSMNDKIIIKDNNCEYDDHRSFLKEVATPQKEALLEIYNHEYKALKEFNKLKSHMTNVIQTSLTEAKKISSDILVKKLKDIEHNMSNLQTSYQDLEIVSRMKDIELTFRRKFALEMNNNIESLKNFVNLKISTTDELCKSVNKHVKELNRLYDSASTYFKESKVKSDFPTQFEGISKRLMYYVNKALAKQAESNNDTSIYKIEEEFAGEVTKVKNYLSNSGRLLKGTNVLIRKT